VLGEEFDHQAIEQPGLLHLTGMAGAVQYLQLAMGIRALSAKALGWALFLAPGQDRRRTSDALVMAFGLGLLQRLELVEDRRKIGGIVALGEQSRENARAASRETPGSDRRT